MSLRLMRIRCVAAKRVLDEAASPAARKKLSREQAKSVCDTLLAPSSSLTTSDVEVVSELVTDVDFEATDLIQVLDAIGVVAKSLKRRRSAQRMHPQIIHYSTAAEWRAMNGGGGDPPTIGRVLEVILSRVWLLGGINISEHTSKFLTSLLIHLVGMTGHTYEKKKLHNYVKAQHKKLVRDQEPVQYIAKLPATPDDMRRDYSWQFQAAYPEASGLPMRAPPEIEQEVIFMDASFRCRGQATSESCSVAVQPLECCLAAQPLQW